MSIVRYNPQSKTFVGQMPGGGFEPRPAGIIPNRPPQPAGPQVVSQNPAAGKRPETKVVS